MNKIEQEKVNLKKMTQEKIAQNKCDENLNSKNFWKPQTTSGKIMEINNKIKKMKEKNKILILQKNKIEDNKKIKMKIENFIEDKELEKTLKYEIKNLKRKIEINEKKYKKALILERNSFKHNTFQ